MAILALVALTGCSSLTAAGDTPATGVQTSPVASPTDQGHVPAAGSCHYHGELPDPACTPGVADPAVNQADITTTICHSGYSKTIRPPVSYTEPLKRQLMASYGQTGSLSGYELDHFLPLSEGGAPMSAQNLWPEPIAQAHQKDKLEYRLYELVCSGKVPLAQAQHDITTDWVAAYNHYDASSVSGFGE
ncbi:MAG TPA: hypothetical protein VNG93_01380 [Candidatus Dormibacteraeota bacterium]|nr:hypothetical protein [Candidatus Dormibacteraeota bacterium]